jgi:enoyl-CoA hydratase/carnithine racemase
MTLRDDTSFLQTQDGVATLWLNRGEQANALSADLVEKLIERVETAWADSSIHTLVLRAAGKHFCSGFDLSNLEAQRDGDLLLRFVRIEVLLNALWNAPIRTVAIAGGRAWGAGADLFVACDMRIALSDASFAFPGAGFGLVMGTRRLAERVGSDCAIGVITQGRVLDASTALTRGLASHLCDPQALDDLLSQLTLRPAVRREVGIALREAARSDARQLADADLAALVRSAGPGLAQRIADYRAAMRQHAGRRTHA